MVSAVPPAFAGAVGGHPIVADILWRRGLTTPEAARAFLDPDQYRPMPPGELPGMAEAVARLRAAIANGERICVWGDFDVDGQTSTSLLLLGLRALGARVDFIIPDRAFHSHGLNKDGIRRAREEGAQVLLTCDCGVTDFPEIEFARHIGLDVIVSDHHDLARENAPAAPSNGTQPVPPVYRLPPACAIVNPKRLPENHPLANLPGVGVAYKLIEALAESTREAHRAQSTELLDLVALGIVADVAYQRDDTRYLLQRGLAQLRAHPRPGIRALMRVANIEPADMGAEDIGFQLGPRLNAVGRLDNAALSVELLTTEDEARAAELAARIETLNQERRVLQRAVEEDAFKLIARDPGVLRYPVVVLSAPNWHPSVLGVVASAVSNRYNKPAILIAARPGEIGRGSARSIRGVDIHAAIAAQAGLIENSGGHPLAAGFGIRSENVPALREGVNRYVAAHASVPEQAEDPVAAVLAWRDLSLQLCTDLERLAPFGPGNPRPVLKSERLKPVRVEPLGNDGRHQAVFLQDEAGHVNRAVWWRSSGTPLPLLCDLVYTLHCDVFRGRARMQVQVESMQTVDADVPAEQAAPTQIGARFRIRDLRGQLDRAAALQQLVDEYGRANVAVWAEGEAPFAGPAQAAATIADSPGACTRLQLAPRPVLVIWSAPPGPEELALALKRAVPQTVVLLTAMGAPDGDQVAVFMRQLAGLLAHAQRQAESPDDAAVVARMAARAGHRVATIQAGVACLRNPGDAKAGKLLSYLLDETRAYRRFFHESRAEAALRV
jgi:single-stranded-DNA-specific exonuclease